MKILFASIIPASLLLASAPARADVANRSGFTMELGIGISQTQFHPEFGDGHSEIGLAPLSLSLGGFVSDRFAILGRMAGTSYFEDVGDDTVQFTSGFYGLVGEYWFDDRFFTSAGAGLALFGRDPLSSGKNFEPESGLGLSLRAGYSFFTNQKHSLRASLELFPSFFEEATTLGTAANFEWQLF